MKQVRLDEYSPGYMLRQLLTEIFPYDSNSNQGVFSTIDNAVNADGDLTYIAYLSTINYLLRRLVTSARYIYRKHYLPTQSSTDYLLHLRGYLRDTTNLPAYAREQVLILLQRCVDESESNGPTQTTKNRVQKRRTGRVQGCYICGRDFEETAEVEHVWPKTLGGSNIDHNLALACPKCNRAKDSFIDGSDFHYEEISLVSDNSDPSFETEFRWQYRIAVLAKHDYCCSSCGKPISEVGELTFIRNDPGDSWHYLNIEAYCKKCQK